MGFPAGLLVLLSVGALLYQPITHGDLAKDGHCFQILPGEEGALNIGQHWGDATPAATIVIELSKVTSAASSFDFRTLDPEGVIFFGDMGDHSDWFVLGLRRGKAEMQISNVVTNISVRGGQRLDDGQWHRMLVMNEGHTVRLEVDGDELLTLGHVSYPIIERQASKMRLAMGGLLLPPSYLLAPMKTPMDGCLRRWIWLNQTTTWWEGTALQAKAKPCFSALRPGSFFPGGGLASFRPADLAGGSAPPNGSWGLEVELGLRAPRQTGLVLAVGAPDGSLALSLALQPTALVVCLGNRTELRLPLPEGPCLDAPLRLQVSPTQLALQLGDHGDTLPGQPPDFQWLQEAWLGQEGRLFIGGLPEGGETPSPQEWGTFRGCLQGIRVQGHQLDLDSALFRSDTIWAHSCPGSHERARGGR
ncbi:sex hormone-binding globulin [Gopherus flavomarginatus]|uniref:sex hormone-binding globulin n=1 Tax=Gopherus flavomarginatus TaxID=286002 RepID=UPI0021CBAD82|nr:sex hormone-binding globulin [Gopherus flavomarginatus]